MFNRESQPTPQPTPQPEPLSRGKTFSIPGNLHASESVASRFEATSAKIEGIKDGETLEFSDIDGYVLNALSNKFKPQKKAGKISFDFNQDADELKVTENTAPAPPAPPVPPTPPAPPTPPLQPHNKETL